MTSKPDRSCPFEQGSDQHEYVVYAQARACKFNAVTEFLSPILTESAPYARSRVPRLAPGWGQSTFGFLPGEVGISSSRGVRLPLWLAKDVTDAAHGLDEPRLATLFQRLAHRRDSHRQDVRFAAELATPDPLHDRVV